MKIPSTVLLLVGPCVAIFPFQYHWGYNVRSHVTKEPTSQVTEEPTLTTKSCPYYHGKYLCEPKDFHFGTCPYGTCVDRLDCYDIIRINTRTTTPLTIEGTSTPTNNGTSTTVSETTDGSAINCGTDNNPRWCCKTETQWGTTPNWDAIFGSTRGETILQPLGSTNDSTRNPTIGPTRGPNFGSTWSSTNDFTRSPSQVTEEPTSPVTKEFHFGTCPYGVCVLRIECIDIIRINTKPTTPHTIEGTSAPFNNDTTTTVSSTNEGSQINCGTVNYPKWCCNGATTIPSFIIDQWTTPATRQGRPFAG